MKQLVLFFVHLIDCCSTLLIDRLLFGRLLDLHAAQNAKLGTSTFEDFLGDSDWYVDATPLKQFFFIDLLRHCPHFKMQEYCTCA
jgi:hypothetical protein